MNGQVASAGDAVSDVQLIAAVRRGNDHAFEQLYRRYSSAVMRFVAARVRDTGRAEDLVQEIFLSALRRMRATDGAIVAGPQAGDKLMIGSFVRVPLQRRDRRSDSDAHSPNGALTSHERSPYPCPIEL